MKYMFNHLTFIGSNFLRKIGFSFQEAQDPRVQNMLKEVKQIGGNVEFRIEQYPDGNWTAESVNVDGIITGGKDIAHATAVMRDAVFTYFEIPPYLCNAALLHTDTEPVVISRKVYA